MRWLMVAAALLLIAFAATVLASTDRHDTDRAIASPPSSGTAMSVALGTPTSHLVLVMLENKEFTQVVGSAAAPYFNNSLVPGGRLFTAHYGSAHPSLPNYLVLTSGQYAGCVTDTCPAGSISGSNLFSEMNGAAVSWKVYAEGMLSNCYSKNSGGYLVRHNPPVYYSNLGAAGDGSCATNDVPLTVLSSDLQQGTLPDFAMVVPNQWSDMHSDHKVAPCQTGAALTNQLCQGDKWLQTWISQLVSDGG